MLKKSFSIVASFLLGLVISISIIACADDITNNTNSEYGEEDIDLLVEKISYLENEIKELKAVSAMQNIGRIDIGGLSIEFEYDDNGRLTKATKIMPSYEEGGDSNTIIIDCTYDKNICKVVRTHIVNEDYWDSLNYIFTLKDSNSRNFDAIKYLLFSSIMDEMY